MERVRDLPASGETDDDLGGSAIPIHYHKGTQTRRRPPDQPVAFCFIIEVFIATRDGTTSGEAGQDKTRAARQTPDKVLGFCHFRNRTKKKTPDKVPGFRHFGNEDEAMRNTPDLIAELEDEPREHGYVAMAVGFETSTVFVYPRDENRLAMLNSAIQVGGTPVGLITADITEGGLLMRVWPYPEHQDSEELDAEAYLRALVLQFRESCERTGGN